MTIRSIAHEQCVRLAAKWSEKTRFEQLRALDNNMQINVALAKFSPIGIDTQEDYIALKKIMEYKS